MTFLVVSTHYEIYTIFAWDAQNPRTHGRTFLQVQNSDPSFSLSQSQTHSTDPCK